jgi:hypothetical protein
LDAFSPSLFCTCRNRRIGLTVVAARKALQDSLHEDETEEDEDEQRYLNMNEEEGDVWDDNSAYIEMLAKEVRVLHLLHACNSLWVIAWS